MRISVRLSPRRGQAVNIPLLHVAQATADAVKKQGMDTVGLLGTRFTLSIGFYTDFMGTQGVKTIVPTAAEQDEIHTLVAVDEALAE